MPTLDTPAAVIRHRLPGGQVDPAHPGLPHGPRRAHLVRAAGAALTSILLMMAAVLASAWLLSGTPGPTGRPDPSPGIVPHTSP